MEDLNKKENTQEQGVGSKKLITNALENDQAIMEDPKKWEQITNHVIENYDRIITLRGANRHRGIDPEEFKQITENIISEIKTDIENGKSVAIMFDGDPDSGVEEPQIGSVPGTLKDVFKDTSAEDLLFIAAQKRSWYERDESGANIKNRNGEKYLTYVFDNNKHEGDHSSFTQSKSFVNAEGYEQWYIGSSGTIANDQLKDYDRKVFDGTKQKVKMFRGAINDTLTSIAEANLLQAQIENDPKMIEKYSKVKAQREHKYGEHWDEKGNPIINTKEYKNLDFDFVKIEVK